MADRLFWMKRTVLVSVELLMDQVLLVALKALV